MGCSQELAFQASSFAGWVSTAADEITSATRNRRIRKNALLWRLRMIPVAQRAAYSDDPRIGYLQSLQVAVLQRRYFETGDGRELFGDQQSIAIDVAQKLEAAGHRDRGSLSHAVRADSASSPRSNEHR